MKAELNSSGRDEKGPDGASLSQRIHRMLFADGATQGTDPDA